MKLCKDCRFYVAGSSESADICDHEKARYGFVRTARTYSCATMRTTFCLDGKLFEPKDKPANG